MSSTDIPEGFKPNFVEEPNPDDELIKGAINVYKKRQWTRGWGEGEDSVCILNSVNVARSGKPERTYNRIPVGVIRRIHHAIFPGHEKASKSLMAHKIMAWNDMGADNGGKESVVRILKKALKDKDPK